MATEVNGDLPRWLARSFAVGAGTLVVNLFAAQPLVGQIAPSLGLGSGTATLIAVAPLLGYAFGLLLLVPLTDVVENRRLILWTMAVDVAALLATALAPSAALFLAAALAMGIATSVIQMLIPFAAALAPERFRGAVVGNVMAGLMIGITLSRPIASLGAGAIGWRGAFAVSALMVGALAIFLGRMLPRRNPYSRASYPALIASLWFLVREEPILRSRMTSAALCFGAFSAFWTIISLRLAEPPFSLGATGVAAFALAGAGGAIVAPIAGQLGDRGLSRPATVAMHLTIVGALLLALVTAGYSQAIVAVGLPARSVTLLLGAAALALDFGVIGDQTLGRRAINLVRPEARGRLNGIFTGAFFLSGAASGAVSGFAWAHGGWVAACAVALALALAALGTDLGRRVRRAHCLAGHSNRCRA